MPSVGQSSLERGFDRPPWGGLSFPIFESGPPTWQWRGGVGRTPISLSIADLRDVSWPPVISGEGPEGPSPDPRSRTAQRSTVSPFDHRPQPLTDLQRAPRPLAPRLQLWDTAGQERYRSLISAPRWAGPSGPFPSVNLLDPMRTQGLNSSKKSVCFSNCIPLKVGKIHFFCEFFLFKCVLFPIPHKMPTFAGISVFFSPQK